MVNQLADIPETRKNPPPEPTEEQEQDELNTIRNEVMALDDEQLLEAFAQEAQKWDNEGINPAFSVHVDSFRMRHEVEVVMELMFEKLGIEIDDFQRRVRQRMLIRMVEVRRNYMAQKARMQIMQGVQQAVQQGKPGMIIPPGFRG